jgi:molybdate transport system substrate-binding protein
MIAAGEADLAVMPVSEIVLAPGVEFAGAVPPEIQFVQTFSAAVVAGSTEVEASQRLIAFLASERASDAIRKSGMEPVAPRAPLDAAFQMRVGPDPGPFRSTSI